MGQRTDHCVKIFVINTHQSIDRSINQSINLASKLSANWPTNQPTFAVIEKALVELTSQLQFSHAPYPIASERTSEWVSEREGIGAFIFLKVHCIWLYNKYFFKVVEWSDKPSGKRSQVPLSEWRQSSRVSRVLTRDVTWRWSASSQQSVLHAIQ